MTDRVEPDKLNLVEMCKRHLRGRWLRYVLSGRRLKVAMDKVTISRLQLLERKPLLLKTDPAEWAREVETHESLAANYRRRETSFSQSNARLKAEVLRLLHNGYWAAWCRGSNREGLIKIPASEWFSARIECDGQVDSVTLANGVELRGLLFEIAGPKPKQDKAVYDALKLLGLNPDTAFVGRGAIGRVADQIVNRLPHIGKRSSIIRKLGDIKRQRKKAIKAE